MPRRLHKTFYVKLSLVTLAAAFAVYSFAVQKTEANSSGPPAGYTNAPGENNCTACHTSFTLDSGTGRVSILDVPMNYTPNQTIPIRVRTTHAGAGRYGFQLTVLDESGNAAGTLQVTDATQTQLMTGEGGGRTYIEHTLAGTDPIPASDSHTWTFNWKAPANSIGRVTFYATGNGANGDFSPGSDYIYSATSRTGSAIADFDGDGRTDVSVYRPSNGGWYLQRSTAGFIGIAFGAAGDIIAPGDFDGDNKTDLAVFRPSNGYWFILNSADNSFRAVPFGANGDMPVAADYDGDGKAEIAVYRPGAGSWYYLQSTDGAFRAVSFGASTDKVVPQDYDGDGKTDFAVFRPSNATWYLLKSADGAFFYTQFGLGTDTPVASDYDGDGRADLAVFRPSTGTWYIQRSSDNNLVAQPFGTSTDRPAPGNYDGDSKTDIAIFRPASGNWYILNSSNGGVQGQQFGASGDLSVPSAYVP